MAPGGLLVACQAALDEQKQIAQLTTDSAETLVPQLVGQVFEAAPPPVKLALMDALLRPLGVLSVVAVAGGVFGKIRFHPNWPRLQDDTDLMRRVTSTDIVELVNHAQKVSFTVLDNLARVVGSSPAVTYSAAATLLMAVLVHRQRQRVEVADD